MAELDWPTYQVKEGHMLDLQSVFLDLHRLLAIFFASEEFSRHARDDPIGTIGDLQEYEWEEITRILISSSVVGRIVDDREDNFLNKGETDVGLLWPDWSDKDTSQVLTLRESFNKIIHAVRVRSDLEMDEERGITYFNNVIYFYGDKNGKEWRCVLRIEDYVTTYYRAFR